MAVDGRKLRDTLRLGSDVFNEHQCSPCAKDNRNVEAIKYCIDCDENICEKCKSDHKRFAVMRGHKIEDKPRTLTGQNRLDLPTTRCDKHGGKLIDVYCPLHDTVGCSTCVAIEHSTCCGMQYIPNVAKGIGTSKELKDIELRIKDIEQQLDSLKLRKQGHKQTLQREKGKILDEIKRLRQRINDQLDKMEKKILQEVDYLFDRRIMGIETRINEVDRLKSNVEKEAHSLKNARKENDAELFVQLKACCTVAKNTGNILKDKHIGADEISMQFDISKEIEQFLANDSLSFGRITKSFVPKSVLHVMDVDVFVASDKEESYITDILCLDNARIIISDSNNKRIKLLGNSYAVSHVTDLPGRPYGLCKVDETTVAVTLVDSKKVQLVLAKNLSLQESFPVGDLCRGIDFHDGLFYVCCGKDLAEVPGHIEVYNRKGKLLRSLYGEFNILGRIQILKNRNKMIVSSLLSYKDADANYVFVDLYEYGRSEITIPKIKNPCGICRIRDRHICLVGKDSNNVFLITEDGSQHKELLTQKDGLMKPIAVCFDENRSTLLLSSGFSKVLKVFTLEY